LHPVRVFAGWVNGCAGSGSIKKRDTAPDRLGGNVSFERINTMSFWTELENILGIATAALPAIAAVNTSGNPAASNNGVENIAKAVSLVTPLVQAGNSLSPTATGSEKLQNAQQAISVAVQIATAAGVVTQPEAAYMAIIGAAINACVAATPAA
jgi:hypothetical protein